MFCVGRSYRVGKDIRMICLLDCNNFFVSCERLFRPDLQGKPVAVLSSNDGCVVARSQEVKDLGVPMGVPYFKVRELCEAAGVTIFSSNFTLYRDISARVMQTLQAQVGGCDVYSIDEAFFAMPEDVSLEEVQQIRRIVMQHTGVPVSIGVASTKTLAKQASAIAKKRDGVCIIDAELWESHVLHAPCASVWGLGRQSVQKLREAGVVTVAEFLALDRSVVRRLLGLSGERIQNELQGICVHALFDHDTEVQQSIASMRSFEKTTTVLSDLESAVAYHVAHVAEKLRERKLLARSIYVSIQTSRHGDFLLHGASAEAALPSPSDSTAVLQKEALARLRAIYKPNVPYKKAGFVASSLVPRLYASRTLFAPHAQEDAHARIETIADSLNKKFGRGTVRNGILLRNATRSSAKLRSQEYTTRWKDIPTVKA